MIITVKAIDLNHPKKGLLFNIEFEGDFTSGHARIGLPSDVRELFQPTLEAEASASRISGFKRADPSLGIHFLKELDIPGNYYAQGKVIETFPEDPDIDGVLVVQVGPELFNFTPEELGGLSVDLGDAVGFTIHDLLLDVHPIKYPLSEPTELIRKVDPKILEKSHSLSLFSRDWFEKDHSADRQQSKK